MSKSTASSKTEDQEIAENRESIASALMVAAGVSNKMFGDPDATISIFDRLDYDDDGELVDQGELEAQLRQSQQLAGKLGLSTTDRAVTFAVYDRVFGHTMEDKLDDVIDLYEASLTSKRR